MLRIKARLGPWHHGTWISLSHGAPIALLLGAALRRHQEVGVSRTMELPAGRASGRRRCMPSKLVSFRHSPPRFDSGDVLAGKAAAATATAAAIEISRRSILAVVMSRVSESSAAVLGLPELPRMAHVVQARQQKETEMRKLISVLATAAFVAGGTVSAFAQATPPAPGTTQEQVPGPAPGAGSGSRPIGPPATTPPTPSKPMSPGTSSIPGGPKNDAQKALDAAGSQGGSSGK